MRAGTRRLPRGLGGAAAGALPVQDSLELGLLSYGTRKSFKPMYEQLDAIEQKTVGGKGWFDKIKQQLSDLI